MKFVQQPPATRQCGQVAIAVIFELSIEQANGIVGHDHGTTTDELIQAIRKMGWRCPDRLIRSRAGWHVWRGLQGEQIGAICKLKYPGESGWHWAVVDREGTWYDGERLSEPVSTEQMTRLYCGAWSVSSYLPVAKPASRDGRIAKVITSDPTMRSILTHIPQSSPARKRPGL